MNELHSASAQVQKEALWDAFCAAHRIAETGVPLFATGLSLADDVDLGMRALAEALDVTALTLDAEEVGLGR